MAGILVLTNTAAAPLRARYNATNYADFTVSATGDLTIAPTGGDTSITGTLAVSAAASFSGAVLVIDGSASSPGVRFTGEAGTGVYRHAAGTLGLAASGVSVARFTTSLATFPFALSVGDTLTAQSTVGPARFALDVSGKATLEGGDTSVQDILTTAVTGLLICTNTNVGGSAVFLVDAASGAVTKIVQTGTSNWSSVKETATSQNVYIETGALKHQNKSVAFRQVRFMFLRTR
jgi:hypothetical protein